jgi:hypothetical protein
MEAIEQAAKDASHISPDSPMLPASTIIGANDIKGMRQLGYTMVGGTRKLFIEWISERYEGNRWPQIKVWKKKQNLAEPVFEPTEDVVGSVIA